MELGVLDEAKLWMQTEKYVLPVLIVWKGFRPIAVTRLQLQMPA